MKRFGNAVEIIDCLGAPADSGGMQVWAQQVCKHWSAQSGKAVFFVIPRWLKPDFRESKIPHLAWPNSSPALRILGQMIVTPLVFLAYRASSLISINAVISPLIINNATTLICHDWRHLKNPNEFGISQRFYRKYWLFSAKRAAQVITVSRKTFEETKVLTDRQDLCIVEPGLDHLLESSELGSEIGFLNGRRFAITYGQHVNKRAELAVEAFSMVDSEIQLVVLSCSDGYSRDLQKIINQHGLSSRVHLLKRLGDESYSWLMRNCAAVLLLSSDEGYGIPVAEAIALGKPVIVAADSGLQEIFGDQPIYVRPDSSALSDLVKNIHLLRTMPPSGLRSWAQAVRKLQEISRGTQRSG